MNASRPSPSLPEKWLVTANQLGVWFPQCTSAFITKWTCQEAVQGWNSGASNIPPMPRVAMKGSTHVYPTLDVYRWFIRHFSNVEGKEAA